MSTEIKNNISPFNLLKRINFHLGNKRKKDTKLVFLLSILSSLAESVSIAILIPFISFIVNPEIYVLNSLLINILDFFNVTEAQILYFIATCFIIVVLVSSFIKIKYIKASNSLADNISSDFRIKIFTFMLSQDFSYHFKKGSNEILSSLAQKTVFFTTIIFAAINIINSILITLAIVFVLIYNEPFYTPIIITVISLFFLIIFKFKSSLILKRGQTVSSNQNLMIDIFQNTIGYLPEIIVYNIKKFFLNSLSNLSEETARSTTEVRTITVTPKIYLETFVIIFVISGVIILRYLDISIASNLAYFAILAFGFQKCLPLISNTFNLAGNFKFSTPVVDNFLSILDEEKVIKIQEEEISPLKFEKTIKLENLSYKYNHDLPNIIDKFSFEIMKGEKVAIKGPTGSGKTTLVNIVSGLLNPKEGRIYIDNIIINSQNIKNWQKNLAIVPQSIFLKDGSVLENIAIAKDVSAIDLEKAKDCARIAQIDNFIESLPNKYNEGVGEKGVRLSGGQIQRLGVARALYRDAKVIILDEATNALDGKTEIDLMNAITKISKDVTLIMISHSDTSLKYFNKIIDLNIKK